GTHRGPLRQLRVPHGPRVPGRGLRHAHGPALLHELGVPDPPAEDRRMSADTTVTARRAFASDNYAGVHPEVLEAIARANTGHETSYGEDSWTARLQELVREQFGDRAQAFPVFNGTAANVVALQALLPPWGAVVCAESAHIHQDEGAAPERVAHTKLYTVPTPDGKLTPELVDAQAHGFGFVHRAQPAV